jgi:benzoyl-CoA reductase/2-hydroxyglutaryl-CoA dehydratase subunit BcrC/BadD/HgdB
MAIADGLERYKKEREDFRFLVQSLEGDTSPDRLLTLTVVRAILDRYDKIIDCAEQGRPFIANYYANAPELFVAMDLPCYMLFQTPFLPTAEPHILDDIDASVAAGLGTDMCTLIRLGIYYMKSGRAPVPTAFIGLLSPCDGAPMLNQTIAQNDDWRGVPMFSTSPPYFDDERGIGFFADELRRMVEFLEEQTGHHLNIERLREVIEESNRQHELWAEYNELRRAVPCPMGAGKGAQAWLLAQNYLVGDPRGTEWFRQLVGLAERRVAEGRGDVPDERLRLFWFDIRPVWFLDVSTWLKDEWKASVVMDMTGYAPYTSIDTSTEESMFAGLSKRYMCDVPMVRQARGTAEVLVNDLVRVVKDYKIDCVVWPAHMGHKDSAASIGIIRAVCRDIGVPFLEIGLDLFDKRYTTMDEVKDRFSRFFTAMGLG